MRPSASSHDVERERKHRLENAAPAQAGRRPLSAAQIWLTSAVEEDNTLHAICVDRTSGQIVHDVEVFRKQDLGHVNAKNTHASPTPVLDGASM